MSLVLENEPARHPLGVSQWILENVDIIKIIYILTTLAATGTAAGTPPLTPSAQRP